MPTLDDAGGIQRTVCDRGDDNLPDAQDAAGDGLMLRHNIMQIRTTDTSQCEPIICRN